eukprot:XP_786089.3 PREDICTED: protein O-mannosyl-transferase 2 [Strongylocentrotus purpuratus]
MSSDIFKKSTVDPKQAKQAFKPCHEDYQKDTYEGKKMAKMQDQSNGSGRGKADSQFSPTRTDSCSDQYQPVTPTSALLRGNKIIYAVPISIISLMALATRFYKLREPGHICWDETHFGKMGSFYINRTFFFDVHPPLGKMLIGLAGYLTGYDGSFPFDKPGDKYGDTEYYGMRAFCTTLGALIIPLTYLTVEEMTKSIPAAIIASSLILFDCGCLTLSQYILLDPILMVFISASVFSLVKFQSCQSNPFSPRWWVWMAVTGVLLACSFSVKWVGLFVILLAGATTALDLWKLLGDLNLTKMTLLYHLLARIVCLICLPAIIYTAFFAVHFQVLNQSGNGDGFYSSAFQAKLIGNKLHNAAMPEAIAYGSLITLKNHRSSGGLLHSHHHLYPEGSGAMQQQVTAYTHKDVNNEWLVKKFNVNPDPNDTSIEYVKHGDLIRLEHTATKRNLHSHPLPAPLSSRHQQVTCYGENGTGDVNDVWRVEIVGGREGDLVKVVKTKLKLVHQINGCALFSHSKTLPKWGWEQLEVTCNPYIRDVRTLWNVEDHVNEKLPNMNISLFVPSFLERFLEAHLVMASGNSNLKPKEGEITSEPWQWPINYRGQRFSGTNETEYRVYLLGNPVIWWGNLVVLAIFCLAAVGWLFMMQRGCELSPQIQDSAANVYPSCGWLLLGWGLHYLPFYLMGRVLYFHHYFPAMVFNSMITGIFLDHVLKVLELKLGGRFPHLHQSGVVILLAIVIHSFYLFYPLSYGMVGPLADKPGSQMAGLHWLSTWEF